MEAYDKGFTAYHNGDSLTNNPYFKSTFEYLDWEDGFLDAMNEDSDWSLENYEAE